MSSPWEKHPALCPDDSRADDTGSFSCAVLSPRGDVVDRVAIRDIVFRGEGFPLPTPLPGGAPRRERGPADFVYNQLGGAG